jgi:hypothetical protein
VALVAGPAGASELVDFARCLSRAGATYYTASWCPHCARQNRMFGNALRHLRMVDCTDGCAGVGSFPTWTFADGSRLSGVASFAVLASRTRCRLGEERDERSEEPATTGSGARERYIGGAKIIEVPR